MGEINVENRNNVLKKHIISTDKDDVGVHDIVYLLKENPKNLEFDNVLGVFEKNLYYYYIVDLEKLSDDEILELNGVGPDNETDCYRITKVHKKTY